LIKKYSPGQFPDNPMRGIILAYGFGGSGKTSLLMSGEEVAAPVFHANFDRRADHLLRGLKQPFYAAQFTPPSTSREAGAILNDLESLLETALIEKTGVFGIDGFHTMWDTAVMALVDPNERSGLSRYAPANNWMKGYLTRLENSGLWTVITAPAKQMWGDYKPPRFMPDCWVHYEYSVLAEVRMYVEGEPRGTVENPVEDSWLGNYKAQIAKSKLRPKSQGVVIDKPTLAKVLEVIT
jgi:hypothetical protein